MRFRLIGGGRDMTGRTGRRGTVVNSHNPRRRVHVHLVYVAAIGNIMLRFIIDLLLGMVRAKVASTAGFR